LETEIFSTTSKRTFWRQKFLARPTKTLFGGEKFLARHAMLGGLLIFFAKASTIHCGFEEIICFLLVFCRRALWDADMLGGGFLQRPSRVR
jgi:hypothetical protein